MEVCYRHRDRETGVACSNCGRPICPECMTATSVGMRCPECSRQRTKVRSAGTLGGGEPTLTYALITINVLVAVAAWLSGASPGSGAFGGSTVADHLAISRATVADGELWRILSYGFLHTQLLHLLFNMFALYILGQMLEPAMGRGRFALVYFVSILAGALGALLAQPMGLTLGASGAVFGLMGAGIVALRRRGINPMESGLGIWLGLNLVFSFTVSGISVGGHIGGLVGGVLVALLLYELGERVRLSPRLATLLAAGIGALAVAGSIAVAGS